MDLNHFLDSINGTTPPQGLSLALKSLWYDGKDDWSRAHDLINDATGSSEAWVHAYLHRKEGDVMNAQYWYRRAGRTMPQQSLQEEWHALVGALIAQDN